MAPNGYTPSERFVAGLCERSFLKLWTHPNPKGKKGKELCDCLVVCGPHVVIISVKEIRYRPTNRGAGWERWTRAAIEKSASQIWGAERWLESVDTIERHDGRVITLPERGKRRYHRLAVALGGQGQVPLKWGDLGNGFVHVCDEYSTRVLFTALDTISDLVEFLDASEALVRDGVGLVFEGGGLEDFIALYISNGRSFDLADGEPRKPDLLALGDGLWATLVESSDFKSMQEDLRQSYIWDRLIELLADDLLDGGMFDVLSKQVTEDELALATMALEPRAYRAVLTEAFLEFMQHPELKSAARVVQGQPGCAYVFMAGRSVEREARVQELTMRCLVVRGKLPRTHTVVGIATDRPGTSTIGYSCDIAYIRMDDWPDRFQEHVRAIQQDLGYFKNMSWPE